MPKWDKNFCAHVTLPPFVMQTSTRYPVCAIGAEKSSIFLRRSEPAFDFLGIWIRIKVDRTSCEGMALGRRLFFNKRTRNCGGGGCRLKLGGISPRMLRDELLDVPSELTVAH